ncbi:MAG: YafY family transcriptional regulator [Rhodobacteraceae bacterium]|nr:YafY family transcriptional regulator [Paracoccaceae bacterium]
MNRSTRLFEVIQILRTAKRPMTAEAIAGRLEVAKRTIYRDIAALQAMRVPIEGEAGIGYVMRPGYDLPPLMFATEEVEAIVVGLALLRRTGDEALERAAGSAASKIASVLPDSQRHVPHQVSGWNRIPSAAVDPALIRQAIRDEAELRIDYRDANGAETRRDIRPLALIYYIDAQVLAAWCHLRQAFRHFRLDRIDSCAPTGTDFKGQADRLRRAWEAELVLP